MPIKDAKQVFLMILSDVRQNTERATKAYEEIGQHVVDADIKEVLTSRAIISSQILARLDECFRMIGEKPVQLSGRIHDVFLEEFRHQVAEIQSPVAKRLFVLAKLSDLAHLRLGEYAALTAAADLTGNHGVGVLLETCMADKLAFLERTRRLIRALAEERVSQRVAA